MRWLLILVAALLIGSAAAPPAAPARVAPCPNEDEAGWNWVRCGNGARGVVTMWGTPKVVSCGDMRWLVRHRDLDERSTPWIVGDYSCGRRR